MFFPLRRVNEIKVRDWTEQCWQISWCGIGFFFSSFRIPFWIISNSLILFNNQEMKNLLNSFIYIFVYWLKKLKPARNVIRSFWDICGFMKFLENVTLRAEIFSEKIYFDDEIKHAWDHSVALFTPLQTHTLRLEAKIMLKGGERVFFFFSQFCEMNNHH